MSNIDKEIEHNGKKIIPLRELNFLDEDYLVMLDEDYLFFQDVCDLNLLELGRINNFINKLYEWHFDVFGMIKKGNAIDINTL